MNRDEADKVRDQIYKCLVEDFEYGTKKDGTPLKRPYKNRPIFLPENDFGTNTIVSLEEVLEKVDMALDFALESETKTTETGWKPLE